MPPRRRAVLSLLASMMVPARTGFAARRARFPRNVGVQLYSFRRELERDLPGTLAAIARMGLRHVEVHDLFGRKAAALRAELTRAGLVAPSYMASYESLSADVAQVVADAKALGASFVACPWIPHRDADGNLRYTREHNARAIADFSRWGAACQKAGLRFLYHPHGYEFAPIDTGYTMFDEIVEKTVPGVVDFEMDVYWVVHAGHDPAGYLKRYPKRFLATHVKDMRPGTSTGLFTGKSDVESNVTVGTGTIDWKPILVEAERNGVAWHFIEDESSRAMEQVPRSLAYLRSLRL